MLKPHCIVSHFPELNSSRFRSEGHHTLNCAILEGWCQTLKSKTRSLRDQWFGHHLCSGFNTFNLHAASRTKGGTSGLPVIDSLPSGICGGPQHWRHEQGKLHILPATPSCAAHHFFVPGVLGTSTPRVELDEPVCKALCAARLATDDKQGGHSCGTSNLVAVEYS